MSYIIWYRIHMETQTTYVSQLGKNQALHFAEANLDSVVELLKEV